MSEQNFCIAELTEKEKQCLIEAENSFKAATGKDCVLIAWQKE